MVLSVLLSLILLKVKNHIWKKLPIGSDHSYHIYLVRKIQENKGRFYVHTNILNQNKLFFYPQGYHWILSKLDLNFVIKNYFTINIFIQIVQLICFNIFVAIWKPEFTSTEILLANIIYQTFPFNLSTWNAKNRGLSTRTIGLIIGEIFIYAALLVGNQNDFYFIIFGALILTIGFYFSQFAVQFILFFTVIISLFDYLYFIIIPIALLLFYLLDKELFKIYFEGQKKHKVNYFKYLQRVSLWKTRPSIYRDLYKDIWLKISTKSGAFYALTNPLVEAFYGFIYLWFSLEYIFEFNRNYILIIAVTLIIFFLSTTKYLRFLGEPQRYLEFLSPLITIIVLEYVPITKIYVVISIAILLNIILYLIIQKISDHNKDRVTDIKDLIEFITRTFLEPEKLRITGNSTEILKHIMSLNAKVCLGDLFGDYRDLKHFAQHYENYPTLSTNKINDFIENYFLNAVILDLTCSQKSKVGLQNIVLLHNYKEIYSNRSFKFYTNLNLNERP